MSLENEWIGPIPLDGAALRVQVRRGGPVLAAGQEPQNSEDGLLLVNGDSHLFVPSDAHHSIWLRSRVSGRRSEVFVTSETYPG